MVPSWKSAMAAPLGCRGQLYVWSSAYSARPYVSSGRLTTCRTGGTSTTNARSRGRCEGSALVAGCEQVGYGVPMSQWIRRLHGQRRTWNAHPYLTNISGVGVSDTPPQPLTHDVVGAEQRAVAPRHLHGLCTRYEYQGGASTGNLQCHKRQHRHLHRWGCRACLGHPCALPYTLKLHGHFVKPLSLTSIRAPDALSCRSLLCDPRTSLRVGLSYGSRSPAKPPPPPERASSTSAECWSHGPAPPLSVCCRPRDGCPGPGGLPPESLDPHISASMVWQRPLWLPKCMERGAPKWLVWLSQARWLQRICAGRVAEQALMKA